MNKRKLKKYAKKKGLPMPLMTNPKFNFKDAGKFPYVKRLTGGQAKLDKNKNNRIDAQDFKILRAEKAKGRGQGLQDEKIKPGKIMKARAGQLVPLKKDPTKPISSVSPSAGGKGSGTTSNGNSTKKGDDFLKRRKELAGAKSLIGKAGRLGVVGAAVAATAVGAKKLMDKIKEKKKEKEMKGDVEGSIKPYIKKKMGGGLAAATERLKAQGLSKGGGADYMNTVKAKKRGNPAVVGKVKNLEKRMGGGMMKKYSKGGGADMSGSRYKAFQITQDVLKTLKDIPDGQLKFKKTIKRAKDFRSAIIKDEQKVKKKMGGGMMKPMSYATGMNPTEEKSRRTRREKDRKKFNRVLPEARGPIGRIGGFAFELEKPKNKMGGGMMKPMGYKKGKSIKVKCKLGRNKPTKMY